MGEKGHREAWLAACRRVFAGLDKDKDNALDPSEDLVAVLASKLPQEEIEYAVEDALQAAGIAGAFLSSLQVFVHMPLPLRRSGLFGLKRGTLVVALVQADEMAVSGMIRERDYISAA